VPRKSISDAVPNQIDPLRVNQLEQTAAAAGIPGPGRWLVADYEPTSLFSLKMSLATSAVGKSLLIPTPYALKMALVDASFRVGWPESACADFLASLVPVDVRIQPPLGAVVTHTFVKVRQEPHGGSTDEEPYISSIAYREVVHHRGTLSVAFDLAAGDDVLANRLAATLPHVSYIGKRGSFNQFRRWERRVNLDLSFTQPLQRDRSYSLPPRCHIAYLDDFGPQATLEILSSFSTKKAVIDKHRKFVETIVPLGLINTGPGFSEYRVR
jgi:hypothetical protein